MATSSMSEGMWKIRATSWAFEERVSSHPISEGESSTGSYSIPPDRTAVLRAPLRAAFHWSRSAVASSEVRGVGAFNTPEGTPEALNKDDPHCSE